MPRAHIPTNTADKTMAELIMVLNCFFLFSSVMDEAKSIIKMTKNLLNLELKKEKKLHMKNYLKY